MGWKSSEDAMPWVGLYIAVASLICTLAMAGDVIRSFWQWKLWFPNKFFTLNAFTLTLMAIALKLPVDLTTKMNENEEEARTAKMTGVYFLVTMLANFLPSLGLMNDRELLLNIVALGILVTTILVNVSIQLYTKVLIPAPLEVILLILCFPFLWPFSVALTVSTSRKKLEQRYVESQKMISSHQDKMFSSKELISYVKKYWMMTQTRNPQFVIACSPVSSAFGVICAFLALGSTFYFFIGINDTPASEYEWSVKLIFIIQSVGIVVGCIAPVFRCITSIGHYNLSKKWSKNQLNVFRVEKHWIQTLQQWQHSHVHIHIPGRHCKMVFHEVKKTFLTFCITLHILVLIICKTISLVPKTFLLILSCCWYFLKSLWERFKKITKASNSNGSSKIGEYGRYVVQIEEDAKLSNRTLRNTLHSITQLLDESKKKEPHNLLKLLRKSTGFNGLVSFDDDRVPSLYPEETHYCWSLVVVTLTAIAISLPNITNDHFKRLLSSMREGLQIVRQVEECLNTDDNLIKLRKAAKQGWTEIDVYRTWLQIKLEKKTHKVKTSKEFLTWLGDEAVKFVIGFKSKKELSVEQSTYKFILASSMYRVSRTVLLHCNDHEKLSNYELFERISTMIADIFFACFTNLPQVIKMKCQHHAIEKREDNIRNAAQLLSKSKQILKILKTRQLPNLDQDSMAYIDKWRVLSMRQTPVSVHISNYDASASNTHPGTSTSSESLIVSIM